MIRDIVRDIFFLSQESEPATKADTGIGRDLMDTLQANRGRCVGMAANMIGVNKRIIIVNMGILDVVMYNPVIVKRDTPYQTEEGCLSLDGVRKTTRWQNIEVEYLDASWKKHRQRPDKDGRRARELCRKTHRAIAGGDLNARCLHRSDRKERL